MCIKFPYICYFTTDTLNNTLDLFEESCIRNPLTKVLYDDVTQELTVRLNQSLPQNTPISISICDSGAVEKYLNQTCSTIELKVSSENSTKLIVIGFPPLPNVCPPGMNIPFYMGIDFSLNGEKFIS